MARMPFFSIAACLLPSALAGQLPSEILRATNPPAALVTAMLAHGCTPEKVDPGAPVPTGENIFYVDAAGAILRQPGLLPAENQSVTVAIVGPRFGLPYLFAVRTSRTRDPDVIRVAGEYVGPSGVRPAHLGECWLRSFRLGDFSAPEGKVELRVILNQLPAAKVGELSFALERVYRAAISFGPYWSRLENPSHKAVTSGMTGSVSDSTLAVSDRGRFLYAFSLTWYFKEVTRSSGARLGPFLALPVGDAAGEGIAGLSVDLGGGVFLLHVGGHFAKVEKLLNPVNGEGGDPIKGTPLVTEDGWSLGWVLGASIDAEAAGRAFGKVFDSLTGAGGD